MDNVTHLLSLSGGKDSTALALLCKEKGVHIDRYVFCDTGVEFPAMYRHLKKLEEYLEHPIEVVKGKHDYFYYLTEYEITRGKRKGEHGYGHPDFRNRWCTQLLKKSPMTKYKKQFTSVVEYHGIAKDEEHRALKNKEKNIKYPLIEWGVTEKEALEYCYSKGFDWEGLYNDFDRVSCWSCPLARIGELRIIYNKYPELWEQLVEADKKSYRKFRSDYSIKELTDRFKREKETSFFI